MEALQAEIQDKLDVETALLKEHTKMNSDILRLSSEDSDEDDLERCEQYEDELN